MPQVLLSSKKQVLPSSIQVSLLSHDGRSTALHLLLGFAVYSRRTSGVLPVHPHLPHPLLGSLVGGPSCPGVCPRSHTFHIGLRAPMSCVQGCSSGSECARRGGHPTDTLRCSANDQEGTRPCFGIGIRCLSFGIGIRCLSECQWLRGFWVRSHTGMEHCTWASDHHPFGSFAHRLGSFSR